MRTSCTRAVFANKKSRFFDTVSAIKSADVVSPICCILLILIGILAILSAQSYYLGSQWKSQFCWAMLGGVVYVVASVVDYKFFLKYGHYFYFASLLLLLMIFTPFGMRRFGATRWIKVAGLVIQPSEFAKLCTLILGAGILARSKIGNLKESLYSIFAVLLVFGVSVFFIMLQPDVGSSLPFFPIALSMLYVSNVPSKFFITLFTLGFLFISIVAWDIYSYHLFLDNNNLNPQTAIGQYEKQSILPLKDYQRNRIIAFVAPDMVDPKGTGVSWNLRQSLIAVGSGGIYGKGRGNGSQAKLGYLPRSVATNDFIFSVIAEEYGFIGGLTVIIIFMILIVNGLRIAYVARDQFGRLLSVGISVMLLVHVCINIGMTLGIVPITGIPLPFISYGGSFMMVCCLLLGMQQSIYMFRKKY